MSRKELTKIFMVISNWKNPLGLHGSNQSISEFNK